METEQMTDYCITTQRIKILSYNRPAATVDGVPKKATAENWELPKGPSAVKSPNVHVYTQRADTEDVQHPLPTTESEGRTGCVGVCAYMFLTADIQIWVSALKTSPNCEQ